MLFTTSVTDSNHKQQPFDQHLAFVRYYCDKAGVPGHQKARELNMQHLVWEESKGMHQGRQCKTPSYAVIDVASIVQKVCICPHFALWTKPDTQPNSFLLVDVLDMWPKRDRIPRDQQQQQQRQQQQQQLARGHKHNRQLQQLNPAAPSLSAPQALKRLLKGSAL